MKKLISVALATIMAASLACTAFASSSTTNNNNKLTRTNTYNGTYNEPTINVTIPTGGKVSLNPYKLKYTETVNGVDFESREAIACYPQMIINESNVGVDISVVVTGKPTNITLEKTSVKKADGSDAKTTKSAYMYVWFSNATATEYTVEEPKLNNDGEPVLDDDNEPVMETVTKTLYTAKWDPQVKMTDDETPSPDLDEDGNLQFEASEATPTLTGNDLDAIVIQSTASKETKVLTLPEPETAVETETDEDGNTTTSTTIIPVYGYYKIGGDMVSRPATAYDKAKDKVDVTIAWTITPLIAVDPDAPTETETDDEG